MKHPHKLGNQGFTLIELLATILIAGIIMAIAVPSLISWQRKNQNNATLNNIAVVEQHAHSVRTMGGYWPSSALTFQDAGFELSATTNWVDFTPHNRWQYTVTAQSVNGTCYTFEYDPQNGLHGYNTNQHTQPRPDPVDCLLPTEHTIRLTPPTS